MQTFNFKVDITAGDDENGCMHAINIHGILRDAGYQVLSVGIGPHSTKQVTALDKTEGGEGE